MAKDFAIYRILFSCLLAAGGILCVWFGYRLFSNGAGLFKSIDKLAIKNREFAVSVTGMSAGGVLMLTSAVWGFWAYSSVPRLEVAGDLIKISQPTRRKPSPHDPGFTYSEKEVNGRREPRPGGEDQRTTEGRVKWPTGGYVAHLFTKKTEEEARESFEKLAAQYASLFRDREPLIRPLIEQGSYYYRAGAGPFGTAVEARDFCDTLRRSGTPCVVEEN